ncbi:MAG: universal stress protein, partial [Pseudomonadota bacterium]
GRSVQRAIQHLAGNTLLKGADMVLVQVGDKRSVTAIEQARDTLAANGISATTRIVEGQPDQVIAATVEEDHFDLLVMGAYGHSRIRSMIIGSTTTQMVHNCRVPILLFR